MQQLLQKPETNRCKAHLKLAYLQCGHLSDCDIILPSKQRLKVHKIVLSAHSEFFRAAFAGGFTESTTNELPINFGDPANILGDVLRSLYEAIADTAAHTSEGCSVQGDILVTFANAIPILVAAEQLQMTVLKDMLQCHLTEKTNHWDALRYLAEASKYAEAGEVLAETFAGTVAPYFHQEPATMTLAALTIALHFKVIETQRDLVLALPPDTFSMLVCHSKLAVQDEWDLFSMVLQYITDKHDPELSQETVLTLLKSVEFADLTSAQLAEAHQCALIPQDLVMEGMMQRLRSLEKGNRKKKRRFAQHSREFVAAGNFDTNGILYYLGTNCQTEAYVNPTQRHNGLRVTSGRMCYGDLASVVGRVGVDVWTDDDPNETWYALDLGTQYRVRLTAYSLRRGGGASRARDWVLEASNDELEWKTVCVHDDDRSLETEDDDYGTHTWSSSYFHPEFPAEEAFRCLKIRMTKPAHDGDWYFAISGIEIYGHLIE